jgi:hypothetical protein
MSVSPSCSQCSGPLVTHPTDEGSWICPACLAAQVVEADCAAAGDVSEPLAPPEKARALWAGSLLYGLSLPERFLRSSVGLAAGAASEASAFLVPQAFQNSKTYTVVVRNSLKFLTEDIAGVPSQSEQAAACENFLARKAVGNFVDLAGLATLHVSPLWLLAIVSDVAYGSRGYVLELAEELKKQGLIDETSTIHHVDDVLEAVRSASGQASELFDTPPLSVDELRKTLQETRAAIASADYTSILPESELARSWEEMRSIASQEDVSLLSVSGAMTMNALEKMKTVSQGTLTGVRVAGGLFNRHVVGHYSDSLTKLREDGFYQTVRDSYQPYIDGVWNNLAVDRETWTEEFLSGRALGKAYQSLTGWFTAPVGPAIPAADVPGAPQASDDGDRNEAPQEEREA